MIRSESRASATSAVAARTSSTGPRLPAARRAREEDHAIGVPWDLCERAHHDRLPTPGGPPGGHRGPQPGIQLAAELLDQALLVLGVRDVALGDQYLTVPGLHSEKAHTNN